MDLRPLHAVLTRVSQTFVLATSFSLVGFLTALEIPSEYRQIVLDVGIPKSSSVCVLREQVDGLPNAMACLPYPVNGAVLVALQSGVIRQVVGGKILEDPVLDLKTLGVIPGEGIEQGLLSIEWIDAAKGIIALLLVDSENRMVVLEGKVRYGRFDAASLRTRFQRQCQGHQRYGGWLAQDNQGLLVGIGDNNDEHWIPNATASGAVIRVLKDGTSRSVMNGLRVPWRCGLGLDGVLAIFESIPKNAQKFHLFQKDGTVKSTTLYPFEVGRYVIGGPWIPRSLAPGVEPGFICADYRAFGFKIVTPKSDRFLVQEVRSILGDGAIGICDIRWDTDSQEILAVSHQTGVLLRYSWKTVEVPRLLSPLPATLSCNENASFEPKIAGCPKPRWEVVSAPPGLALDPTTGRVLWSPWKVETLDIKFRVNNGVGDPLEITWKVLVVPNTQGKVP